LNFSADFSLLNDAFLEEKRRMYLAGKTLVKLANKANCDKQKQILKIRQVINFYGI